MVTVIRNSHMVVWLLHLHITSTLGHNVPPTIAYEQRSRATRYSGIPLLAIAYV